MKPVRGGLRIRLKLHGGLKFSQLGMDRLPLFISAPDDVAFRLHELLLGSSLGSWVGGGQRDASPGLFRCPLRAARWASTKNTHCCPKRLRGFSGHRLLQEYAAMPQRLLFFEVSDLARRLALVQAAEAEIVLLLSRAEAALEPLIDANSLALYCTPAINLFPKRLDRIQLDSSRWEYQAVPDRTRPMDFEVHTLETVTGFGTGQVAEQRFSPLYASFHDSGRDRQAFYTVRREPRLLSSRQRLEGPRSAYIGQEMFVSLVDPNNAPYREDIRQLSLSALVTNRDLPVLLPGASTTWALDGAGPVNRIETLRGPSRPVQRIARGDVGWALISVLTQNYLSIAGEDPQRAAAALRSLLALHGPEEDNTWAKQVDGIRSIDAKSVVRRLPFAGPLTFGCGVGVTVSIDELGFQGASAFLLGTVLERFFARHASANSFVETLVRSESRGDILRGKPRIGSHAVL